LTDTATTPTLRLSPRQAEVSVLIAAGLTIKGIAEELSITPRTVKFHAEGARDRILEVHPDMRRHGVRSVILRYFAIIEARAFRT
jgi:DNA-binding NarL/FixJ family response regulator